MAPLLAILAMDERPTEQHRRHRMSVPLAPEQAQAIFDALAAMKDQIAFDHLAEGCECRAQLMIEAIQAMGIEPGRAWALAVDRPLAFPTRQNPRQSHKWSNHVAPMLAVEGAAANVLVIDPSTQTGPVTPSAWATSLGVRSIEIVAAGMSQAEIMDRQRDRALHGAGLDAVVFILPLGEPPIPELGGTGFRIGLDPPEGPSAFARAEMQRLLGQ
jgi:hypothetical protein